MIEFKEDTLETMSLNKLSKVYNKGKKELNNMINKSNSDIINLIKIQSNLIENKQEIESTETKLNNLSKTLTEVDFETELKNQLNNSNFDLHGLLLELFFY